jgi:hypothetical protein
MLWDDILARYNLIIYTVLYPLSSSKDKIDLVRVLVIVESNEMRFVLSKEDIRYHEVISYNEVQYFFSLLIIFILFIISYTFSNPLLFIPI